MLVTADSFDWALDGFTGHKRLIADTETTGLHPWLGDRICGVSLATPALDHVAYFPFRHEPGGNLKRRHLGRLITLLNQCPLLTGWNLKFDIEMLYFDGLELPEYAEDVMLACHHMNENDKPFELKRWASKYIDPSANEAEEELKKLLRSRKLKKKEYSKLWPDELERYACDDVIYSEKLRQLVVPELKLWTPPKEAVQTDEGAFWQSPYKLWQESNFYMLELARMEMRGFKLDVPLLEKFNREAIRNAKKQYQKITEMAGYEINLRSWMQLRKWLKVSSTAKDILEQMDTPEAEAILTFRAWDKASNTYYKSWLKWMTDDGILHPNLNLHRVVTGRQSASDPNTHAVPRERTEYKVKQVVVARKGHVIISADYNQAEMRVGVSVAQEENMAKIFRQPGIIDLHQSVADALKLPKKDGRNIGKTINFMILYGGGAAKLAYKAKIPFSEAQHYLKLYHTEYWHFRYVSNFWTLKARYQRYIRLWTGRLRHFNHPLANPKDAFNSFVQGGVAEMLRISILRLGEILPDYRTHMLLQIHDQILFEAPEEQVDTVIPIIQETMEDFHHWMIPPKVDVKIGERWGNLEDYEVEKAA